MQARICCCFVLLLFAVNGVVDDTGGRGAAETISMADQCESQTDAWKPGDLNRFFTNLTTLDDYKQYEPTVISRPFYLSGDTNDNADYKIGPWVVVLENILTEEEADRMIQLGELQGFQRSTGFDKTNADGSIETKVDYRRTSSTAWCIYDCYKDPVTQQVINRVANITKIAVNNSEWLQLLKYEEEQFYYVHHDYLEALSQHRAGHRVLTVLLYLNNVEEGGGTNFPDLDITVHPKRGRALIWPNVKDEAPNEKDERTIHQALPVTRGVKYGANAWIHQRDFKTPTR